MTSISLGHLLILVIVIAAFCGIVAVALRAMNIAIPHWLKMIGIIIAVACVAVLAIKFVAGMAGVF